MNSNTHLKTNISALSTARGLLLASAIISTIFAVPGLGWVLSILLQIPMIAFFVLAIITLIFAKKANVSIAGSIISIIANILSFISYGILLATSSYPRLSPAFETLSSIYLLVGVITWIIFIASAIVLFFEFFNAQKKLTEAKEQLITQPQQMSTPKTSPIIVQPEQIQQQTQTNPFTVQLEQTQQQTQINPFTVQPEQTQQQTQANPFTIQPEQTQQQTKTNPFTVQPEQTQQQTQANPFIKDSSEQ
ncbi:MAG: hypothetical protein ACRCV7_04625 [Culicoidibacterales bacterium]